MVHLSSSFPKPPLSFGLSLSGSSKLMDEAPLPHPILTNLAVTRGCTRSRGRRRSANGDQGRSLGRRSGPSARAKLRDGTRWRNSGVDTLEAGAYGQSSGQDDLGHRALGATESRAPIVFPNRHGLPLFGDASAGATCSI
jgi:hypothetical protein